MATRTKSVVQEVVEIIHPLAHLIPDKEILTRYKHRTIDGMKDTDLLEYAFAEHINVLMIGDTGPGKTMLVSAYCALNQIPLVTVQCNGGIDPNSFWGQYVPNDNGVGIRWQYSEVALVVIHGGVCLLDEMTFMPPKTAASFHSAMDFRRQVTILEHGNELLHCHDTFAVVATANEGASYAGTRPMNKATRNRFWIKMVFDYDPVVEAQLIRMPVILDLAKQLREHSFPA